jgi:hypothetical protein
MGMLDVHFAFVSGALHSKCQRGEYEENESCFHCELLWNLWFFFGIASLLLLALPFIHLSRVIIIPEEWNHRFAANHSHLMRKVIEISS